MSRIKYTIINTLSLLINVFRRVIRDSCKVQGVVITQMTAVKNDNAEVIRVRIMIRFAQVLENMYNRM